MSATFVHIPKAEAMELGRGNQDGWADYVRMRPPEHTKTDAAEPEASAYVRGYVFGYRAASRGKTPMMMRFQEALTATP